MIMKLAQLFSEFSPHSWGENKQASALGLTSDSREVKPGSVFVAIRGTQVDGHDYLSQAVAQGAVALVVESQAQIPSSFKGTIVEVIDSRMALDELAQIYFGHPAESLFCVGVTGTNGKTSVTYMVENILTDFGWPTGVMGTVDHHLGEQKWISALTTPDPVTLQTRLREFKELGAKASVFEVSSHALEQKRAHKIPFDVAVFTNLSRDHMDYHGNMSSYFQAKNLLFKDILSNSVKPQTFAVINNDDPYGARLEINDRVQVWTYGIKEESNNTQHAQFVIQTMDFSGTWFELKIPGEERKAFVPLIGLHNVYNVVAACLVGLVAGVPLPNSLQSLANFSGVPGRLQRVENNKGLFVFVDYAHTDAALASVLGALNEVRKALQTGPQVRRPELLVVCGCGGDRDRGKRPLMAQAACLGADKVFFTSDNPRSEDPEQILADMEAGIPDDFPRQNVCIEPNRRQAMTQALQMAQEGDVILVAGKGHEDYQIIGQQKIPFSDMEVMKELLG